MVMKSQNFVDFNRIDSQIGFTDDSLCRLRAAVIHSDFALVTSDQRLPTSDKSRSVSGLATGDFRRF